MNNQKIINEIKDLLSKLKQEIKNIKDMEKFKNFIPKEGEYYFFINIDGTIGSFVNTNSLFDKDILKRNRVFKTKEHAEEYREFMDMMKEKSRPFIHGKSNYPIYYHHADKKMYYGVLHYSQNKELYFDKKVAEQLINDYPNEITPHYLAELIYLKARDLGWYE